MNETPLVVMNFHLDGWFDTGSTSVAVSVARYHFGPGETRQQRIRAREELVGYRAEVFLTEHVESDLTTLMMKAFGTFTTAMALP